MKKTNTLITIILFFTFLNNLFSQRYGNEWITYDQEYLKMVIDTKGIYRITKADLDGYGFSTLNKNPQNFQLFFRGNAIAINVIGENDGTFDDGDYIEFYAINNDGKQDIELYDKPASKPDSYNSLYSDETAYFLTVGNALGIRMANEPVIDETIVPDQYFIYTKLRNFSNQWNFDSGIAPSPILLQSKFEIGEGLTGTLLNQGYTENIVLDNLIQGVSTIPKFESSLISRSNYDKTLVFNFGNSQTASVVLPNLFYTLPPINNAYVLKSLSTITSNTVPLNITYSSNAAPGSTLNRFSFFYHKVTYPRLPIFADNIEYSLLLSTKSHLQLSAAPAQIFGYDITDIENQAKLNISIGGGVADIYTNNTATQKNIWLSSTTKKPKRTQVINFSQIDRSINDFIIITDGRIRTGADSYKTYRESTAGGNYKVLVAETKAIYDEFCFGERNPIALRRFIDYMTSTPKAIKYLFLIGKSVSKPNLLKTQETADYVPTFGYPGSDVLFSSGLQNNPEYIPAIPTGRLNVSTNAEITNYLNKVILHESLNSTNNSWQKNMLGLAGPTYPSETTLANTLEDLRNIAVNGSIAADPLNYSIITKPLSSFNTTTGQYPTFTVDVDFYNKINAGVGIFAYYGHGFLDGSVYNFGYMSVASTTPPFFGGPANYNNYGKYPLMLAYGCSMANSFTGVKDITSDWVNTPDRGAINAIGQSWLSYEVNDTKNLTSLFNTWFGTLPNAKTSVNGKQKAINAMTNGTIGNILKQAAKNNANTNGDPIATNDLYALSNFHQTILVGDPAVVIFKANSQPLPLSLLAFNAIKNENNVQLNWVTENEINFEKFEIERSINGKIFQNMGFVKSNVLLLENKIYSFVDENPMEGINYYKLKMVDLDGTFKYSKIISLNFENEFENYKILGNPTSSNKINFEFYNYLPNSAKIFDMKGNEIPTEITNIGIGRYTLNIKNEMTKGVYLLEIKNTLLKSFTKKIVFN